MSDRNKDLFNIPADGQFTSAEQVADDTQAHYAATPWYYRKSVVAGVALALSLGPIAGVEVYKATQSSGEAGAPSDSSAPKPPADWDEKMQKAEAARKALAERYASCEITTIADTHTSEKSTVKVLDRRGLPMQPERVTRNEVHMTVRATKTEAAMQAEKDYADGTPDANIVQWYPFSLGASTDIIKQEPTGKTYRVPIPLVSKAKADGPTETFSLTMYPRTDRLRTTSADVSLFTHLETYNPYVDGSVTYEAMGRISCGAIKETLVDGKKTWQLDPNPAVAIPPVEYTYQQCAVVPIEDQPGMATRQCS